MLPQAQERVFFDDGSVYVSDTRLVLRKGGVYPIASLAQVTLGRLSGKSGMGTFLKILIFLSLLIAGLVYIFAHVQPPVENPPPAENPSLYLVIAGSLFLLAITLAVFQAVKPVYVVTLRGSFGIARPIQRRNRRYVEQVVTALNQALNRDTRAQTYNIHNDHSVHDDHSIHDSFNGQLIKDSFHHASGNAIGDQAQAAQPYNLPADGQSNRFQGQ